MNGVSLPAGVPVAKFSPGLLALDDPGHLGRRNPVGIFTPTEAAAVALVYAIALSVVYQEVTLGELLALSQETMRSTAEVLIIVGAAAPLPTWSSRPNCPR